MTRKVHSLKGFCCIEKENSAKGGAPGPALFFGLVILDIPFETSGAIPVS
jgi:hypothetical protein